MKSLLITFFMFILGFSLFFDGEKGEVSQDNLSARSGSYLIAEEQEAYDSLYAKKFVEISDSVNCFQHLKKF